MTSRMMNLDPSLANPAALIEALALAPHPEGGWYRQTWQATSQDSKQPKATAIHFLLESHQHSHWHRVHESEELWLWHAGSPLVLAQAADAEGPVTETILGPDILGGQAPQILVPTGNWQAARPITDAGPGWTLVSCVVSPGFDFANFELAPADWAPHH